MGITHSGKKRTVTWLLISAALLVLSLGMCREAVATTDTVTIAVLPSAAGSITVSTSTSSPSSSSSDISGPVSGVYTVTHNKYYTFSVTANANYQLQDITVGTTDNGTSTSFAYKVGGNVTATATFASKITATAGANGSITPSAFIPYNTNATYSFTPNAGYMVDTVTVDGVAQSGSPTSYTFTSVTAPHTISVTFKVKPQWTLNASASPAGGGTITPTTATVYDGANQSFTITTNANYRFVSITDNGVNWAAASPYNVSNVKANHTITANFIRQYTLTTSSVTGGTIFPAPGTGTVDSGSTFTYTATADSTHYISTITVGGVAQAVPANSAGPYSFNVTVNSDTTVTVTFALRPQHTITTHVWSYLAGPPAGYYADNTTGGTVSPTNPLVYDNGSVTFTMTPAAGYAFRGVFTNNCTVDNGAANPFTLSNVTANDTVCFRFRAQDHTITATAHPNGTITPSGAVPASQYETANFSITPNAGYDIDYVTVSPAYPLATSPLNWGAVSSVSIALPTKDYAIDAYFKVHNYTINATAGTGGSISPPGATSVPNGGSQSYTITPDSGYLIQDVKVDGVSQGPVTTWTFSNVGLDHSISATFMLKVQYKLFVDCGANGTISPAGTVAAGDTLPSVLVDQGSSQTFTITGNAGYNVLDVKLDGVSQGPLSSYTFANIAATHTISATFIASWSITASAGANGSIVPMGTVKVNNGGSKTFTITPNTGYNVADVIIDGATHLGPTTSYTFTGVTANHTIVATFVFAGSGMMNYCNNPPFIAASVRPNLLLLLDNSASMYDLAYTNPANYCYDDTYDDTRPYTGYFDQSSYYSYDFTSNKFTGGATLPSSCTKLTAFACVNMTGTAPNRTVNQFVASGKFLNWLSASKLDIEKKVLTGGKYNSTNDILIGEARGCLGRRFVKAVSLMSDITFAVRGPYSYQADYTNPSTQGGQTRIEIYDAAYNTSACEAAVSDWQAGASMGTTQNDTKACLGVSGNATTPTSVYNHIIHNCYWYQTGHAMSNDQPLQNECQSLYTSLYGNDPSKIVNSAAGDAICSSVLHHPLNNNNTTGFIGKCYTPSTGAWDDACTQTEMADFCAGVTTTPVTDPSSGTYVAGSASAYVPAFVMDSGVTALGPVAGTFLANVSIATPPSGLIQEFRNSINFGTMIFNYNGSGTECNPGGVAGSNINCAKYCNVDHTKECYLDSDCPSGSCVLIPKLDGGQVISYINYDPIGDHDSGMISTIDGIKATSWTPFAEVFYDAIGYFASPKVCNNATSTLCTTNSDCPSGGSCNQVTGTSRTDLRLQTSDYDATKYPSMFSCQKNNILIVTDGMSTADENASVSALASLYSGVSGGITGYDTTNSCPANAGSRSLDDLAWIAKNRDINTLRTSAPASSTTPFFNRDSITTHVVFTGTATGAPGQCDPATLMQQTATSGGGTYQQAADPTQLEDKLRRAFQGIAVASSSGTAASILSNSEGSGANILQAVFYPQKTFDSGQTNVKWIGEMQNLWYYVDPFIGNSTMREDSDYTAANLAANAPHYFNLMTDKVTKFKFDPTTNQTMVELWRDINGDGSPDTYLSTVSPEDVKSIWRAGKQLWSRDLTVSPRTVYTQTGSGLTSFTGLDTTSTSVRSLLQAADQAEADRIISFVSGVDDPAYRSRSIIIPSVDTTSRVWKLGDIVSSTPRVQSSVRLNYYDFPPPGGYSDSSYGAFISTSSYQSRGMAFVGANDGMLHAFKQGKLDVAAAGDLKATLSGTNLGQEQWGFIPMNALPYLKYLTDPDYSHLFFVEGETTLADVSINNPSGCGGNYWDCVKDFPASGNPGGTNWATVLVGSMGIGGASRDVNGSCNGGTVDCVKSPIANGGYSSYFALDITNQSFNPSTGVLAGPPTFLWEFSDPALGYATSGAAILKVSGRTVSGGSLAPDPKKNGRWFAVFASGPTGPIDSNACQFKGKSDQSLKLFVVDLKTGTLLRTIDTGIANAFSGRITLGVIDADRSGLTRPGNYQDDAVYVGYVKKASDGTWTDGGVLRLMTKEDPDPNNWQWSMVIDGVGAVTTSIAKIQDTKNKNLWLYFGSGRYFFNQDDMSSARRIYAIKEPCYTNGNTLDSTCTTTIGSVALNLSDKTSDTSDSLSSIPGKDKGWYIDLEAENIPDAGFGAERVLTDPVSMTNGAVFFQTFKPTADPCSFGGNSYMWVVKYDTGAPPPAAALEAKALIQLSTGSFQEMNLGSALTEQGGRRSGAMTGFTSTTAAPIVSKSSLKPVKRILHILEH